MLDLQPTRTLFKQLSRKKKNIEVKTVVLKYVPIIRELIVKEENPKN